MGKKCKYLPIIKCLWVKNKKKYPDGGWNAFLVELGYES